MAKGPNYGSSRVSIQAALDRYAQQAAAAQKLTGETAKLEEAELSGVEATTRDIAARENATDAILAQAEAVERLKAAQAGEVVAVDRGSLAWREYTGAVGEALAASEAAAAGRVEGGAAGLVMPGYIGGGSRGGVTAADAAREDASTRNQRLFQGFEAETGPSEAEQRIVAANAAITASTATASTAQIEFSDAYNRSSAEVMASSTGFQRAGLSSDFIQSFLAGEVTLKQFGTALSETLVKFAGWGIAGAAAFGIFEGGKRLIEGAVAASSGVHEVERAFVGKPFSRSQAEAGALQVSREVNVDPRKVYEAQFFAARGGVKGQQQTLEVGRTALEANKLDEVPIQDATKGLGALAKVFGLNAEQIRHVFNELNEGQLNFNARLSQTLPMMGRAASAWKDAGGTAQNLARELVIITSTTGGGGGQGGGNPATFLLREAASNLVKPKAQEVLRREGLNPEEPIGELNKQIQEWASGQIGTSQGRMKIAEVARAIGGGGAQGGRYGLGDILAGPSGLAATIDKEMESHSKGVHAEDLSKKLDQFNEQVAAIGNTFRRLGAEVGGSGVAQTLEHLTGTLLKMGGVVELVGKPLAGMGHDLGELPPAFLEIAATIGLVRGATALSRSEKWSGLRGTVGEVPMMGWVSSDASRQVHGAIQVAKGQRDFAAGRVESLTSQFRENAAEAEYHSKRYANWVRTTPVPSGEPVLGPNGLTVSPEREKYNQEAEAYRARSKQFSAKGQAIIEETEHYQEKNLEAEKTINDLKNKRIAAEEKAVGYAEGGGYIQGPNKTIVGAGGTTGTRAAAAQNMADEDQIAEQEAFTEKTAEQNAVMQANIDAAQVQADTLAETDGALAEQWTVLLATMRKGAADMAAGFQAIFRAEGEGAGMMMRGGAEMGGGGISFLGSGIGAATKGMGARIMPALMTGMIGGMVAEQAGQMIGGHRGKEVSSLGTGAAYGAAAGMMLPFIGPAFGAGIGLTADYVAKQKTSTTGMSELAKHMMARNESGDAGFFRKLSLGAEHATSWVAGVFGMNDPGAKEEEEGFKDEAAAEANMAATKQLKRKLLEKFEKNQQLKLEGKIPTLKESPMGKLMTAKEEFGVEAELAAGPEGEQSKAASQIVEKASKRAETAIKMAGAFTKTGKEIEKITNEKTALLMVALAKAQQNNAEGGQASTPEAYKNLETNINAVLSPAKTQFTRGLKLTGNTPDIEKGLKQYEETISQSVGAQVGVGKKVLETEITNHTAEANEFKSQGNNAGFKAQMKYVEEVKKSLQRFNKEAPNLMHEMEEATKQEAREAAFTKFQGLEKEKRSILEAQAGKNEVKKRSEEEGQLKSEYEAGRNKFHLEPEQLQKLHGELKVNQIQRGQAEAVLGVEKVEASGALRIAQLPVSTSASAKAREQVQVAKENSGRCRKGREG